MKSPLQLEVHGFKPSAHVREAIEASIAKLEERYGRITSCRLAIRAPDAHHRMGEPFRVTVQLALPNGREVHVGRTGRGLDRRHADVNFAIGDAFRRAVRQLRENSRKLQGKVKVKQDSRKQGEML